MFGNHYQTRTIRRFQRTFEDRTLRHRRQIQYIAREQQRLQGALQDLRPTLNDDAQRRSEKIAQIRKNIAELQDHLVDYNEAKAAWEQIIAEYELTDHREDDWARAMLQQHDDYFPAADPSPLAKSLKDYRALLDAVEDHDSVTPARDAPAAGTSSTSTTQDNDAAAVHARPPTPLSLSISSNNDDSHASSAARAILEEPAAQGSEPSHTDGEDSFVAEEQEAPTSEPSHTDGDDVSVAEGSPGGYSLMAPPAHALPSPVHHFYSPGPSYEPPFRQSDNSDAETIVTAQTEYQSPEDQLHAPPRSGAVPIVQQLDHGDGTTPSTTPPPDDYEIGYTTPFMEDYSAPGPTGLFAYTDGLVSRATSMAWHTPYVGGDTHVTVGTFEPTGNHAARPQTPPVSSDKPTEPQPSVHQPMASTTELAGGRGPSSAPPSGPQPVDASGPPLLSAVTNEASGATATPPTSTALADRKSTSVFYTNATYTRSIDDTATPLVLKELPITPFGGNVREYPTFRDRFLDLVEGRPNFPPRQKLQYLLQCLRDEPLRLANGFQFTDQNYFIVVDLLEERYGNKDVIRNLLMGDLITLRPPAPGAKDLRRFHDEALQIATGLKQLGDEVDNNRLYEQTLMSKLSPDMKMEIIRHSNYAKEKTITSILNGLRDHLQVLELSNNSGVYWDGMVRRSSPSPNRPSGLSRARSPAPQFSKQRERQDGYAAHVENPRPPDQRQSRNRCALCGHKHYATHCSKYRTVAQRFRRVRNLGLCFLCLQGNHWVEECSKKTDKDCYFCKQSSHHRALCYEAPKDEQKGRLRRDPARTIKPAGQTSAGGPQGGRQGVDQRQIQAPKSVTWKESLAVRDSTAAEKASPSTQMSSKPQQGKSNSTTIPRKKRSRSQGTGFKGRNGTQRPTTALTAESIEQKSVNACDGDRLLPEHKSLLPTDGCSHNRDSALFDRRHPPPGSLQAQIIAEFEELYGQCEDESFPSSSGHNSNYDSDLPISLSEEELPPHEWFPPYQEASGYAVTETLPADTPAVLLECVKVTACNPFNGKSRDIIAFFDLGSSMTYVSTKLAHELDLPCYQRRQLSVNTFASNAPKNLDVFATELVLRSMRGTFTRLKITASDCIVPSLRTALVEDSELPALQKNECALISSRETPDILIGQDTIQLFRRQTGQRLPSGFNIVDSFLGPMIGGAGKVANTDSKAVPTSTVADTSERTGPHRQGPQERLANGPDGFRQDAVIHFPPPPSNFNIVTTTSEEPVSGYFSTLADATDSQIFGDFSFLENAGIGTCEMTPDDQAAADMLEKLITREPDGRYKVPLLFRTADGEPPSNEDLPTNLHLGKGRGISTRNTLAKAPEKLAEYDGIIQDYEKREFIGKAPKRTPFTKHCLSHHPVHKETSTTTATRPVYDASAKLPGRTCLNDWLYRGPVLLPTVPAVLLRSRLPIIIIVSDIGKAFLQMAVKESHRDCLWFVWFKDPTQEPSDDNIVYYRFNRVPFGLKSSPYLLAGVIKKHLESEGTPLALEMLKNCYVDNVLLMADTVDEALQKYRDSKAIFAKAQMPLREYASNNSEFNDALDIADRADLHKLRELGIRWDVTADYWDIPLRPKPPTRPSHTDGREAGIRAGAALSAPSHTDGKEKPVHTGKSKRKRRKGVDDGRLTKRFMLRLVAQVFDPLGFAQAVLLLAKLVIQELWKADIDWDDDIPEKLAQLWLEAIKDFDSTTIRIPRRISMSKIHSAEVHIFTDGSSQAYGSTAYLRVREPDGTYRTNLVYARAKVKPIKDAEKFTIPRMELLGVLIGARIAKFLHAELSIPITATYLWSDSTIVLHQVAENEKVKEVFVENRLKEIRSLRDELHIQFRYVPTDDNPADIASRGLPAAELQRCSKWWFGAPFLAHDSSHWPSQPASLSAKDHEDPPQRGQELFGSTAFTALFNDVFIPPERVSQRKLRARKKPNPLDIITKPLPPTLHTTSAVAAIERAAPAPTRPTAGTPAARPPKLPSDPILPAVIRDQHNSWTQQLRITFYVLRAVAIMRRGAKERTGPRRHPPALGFELESCLLESKPLRPSVRDLHITEMITLRKTQLKYPPSDNDRQNLGIFEHQGLLYVKGRLGNMKLRPTALTPIYLPREAPETKFIILEYHRLNGHAGTTNTLANIRMRYWFTHGRRTIQSAIQKHCFTCRREAMHPCATPPWPQLPLSRVSKTRPFYHTGLDFFGPVYLRVPQDSGGYSVAKYSVAIFTCMTFRCVHLDLCPDLSTQSFLDAFQRFGSRREFPARILSDNGLSFITAREVINQIKRSHAAPLPVKRRNPARKAISARLVVRRKASHIDVRTPSTATQRTPPHTTPKQHRLAVPLADLTPEEELVTDFCQRNNIEWQTITELSPWRGGSYERLIGIVKQSLRRSIGKSKPTLEQYRTLLAVAERTANCRPLTYVAESNDDFYLVRPIDFIHPLLRDEFQQDPLDPPTDSAQAKDDPDFVAPGENRLHAKLLRDLKRARELADAFWIQFRDGVLLDLRNRGVDSKRRQLGKTTIQAGDLVLVKEEGLPRTDWRLALVLQLLPSADGFTRSARIRFARTHEETNRAFEHLYPIGQPLPFHSTFFISELDVVMDNHPSNAQQKPIDADMILQALADPRRRQALEQLLNADPATLSASAPSHTDGNDKDSGTDPRAEPQDQTEAPTAQSKPEPSHTDGKGEDSGAEQPVTPTLDTKGPSTAADHHQLLNNIAARMRKDDRRPSVVFLIPGRHHSAPADQHHPQPTVATNITGADNTQRIVAPATPAPAAAPRADHEDDQEESNTELRNTDRKRSEPSHTDGEEAAAQKPTDCKRPEPSHNDGEGNAANSSALRSQPEGDKQPTETQPQDPIKTYYDKIQADHAAAVARRRQRLMEAAAQRQQQLPAAATVPPAPPKILTATHEEVLAVLASAEAENLWLPASTSDWAVEQRRIAATRNEERWRQRYPHTVTDDDERLDADRTSRGQRLGARAAFERDPLRLTRSIQPVTSSATSATPTPSTPASTPVAIFATSPFVDWTRLPEHLGMEEIWRRTRQFFSFEQNAEGNTLDKIDLETLMSPPMQYPDARSFLIQTRAFIKDDSTWHPKNTCLGQGEPACFHVSVGATLIIIKNRWREYKQIAASQELLAMLNALMRLHIRNFGQMILLVYAARLAGDHNRMESILRFIDEVLRARDLDYDTARAIQRHVPKMVQGVDAKKNPYPFEGDFSVAAERWCNYCYKAFIYIYERLSGPIVWNPEWLQDKDIPKEFRQAIDKIVLKAAVIILSLKERIYKRYVLQRIKVLEEGATTFDWTPLPLDKEARRLDWPEQLRLRAGKYILLVDEENDHLFCDELHQEDITIFVMPSTNREDVLRFVRNIVPGPDTQRVYFWFGREYIQNGNNDFGCLITELCHFYSTFFSRIYQYVVLPPYTRLKPDAWTFDVLCLYLQREQLLPHARVILHPYDVRLWHRDQEKFTATGRLPSWKTTHQSADGTICNWSTVEARKYNMKVYHGSDLWTWYKNEARGKLEPDSIQAKLGPNGQVIRPSANGVNAPSTSASLPSSSASAPPPTSASSSTRQPEAPPSATITTETSPPSRAEQDTTAATRPTLTVSPAGTPPPAPEDPDALHPLVTGENPLLASLIAFASQKAAEQIVAAFKPQMDELLRRIDRLNADQDSPPQAEDRPQDPWTEQ